jgi:hypothetical protein
MHEIEPYYNWRYIYVASNDYNSPFYGKEYSEFTDWNIDYFIGFKGEFDDIAWRKLLPNQLFNTINSIITKRLSI